MIDLHTHSTASDGTFSPTELAASAKEQGLSALALTDHDTLDGLDEAENEAKKQGLIFIRGIEISVNWKPGEFHLLGLDLRKPLKEAPALSKIIKKVQEGRIKRNMLIAEKLSAAGFDISYQKIVEFAGNNSIGRPHFAAYMVEHKMVKNRQLAFDKYFGKGRPFFAEKENADLCEAIFAVKEAGGIPVIAHPMSLYLSWSVLPKMIADFKAQGLVGLEAWNASTRYNDCKRLEALADELGLITTAGSDFHGKNRQGRRLGYTAGDIKIEDKFYKNLQRVHPDLPNLPT